MEEQELPKQFLRFLGLAWPIWISTLRFLEKQHTLSELSESLRNLEHLYRAVFPSLDQPPARNLEHLHRAFPSPDQPQKQFSDADLAFVETLFTLPNRRPLLTELMMPGIWSIPLLYLTAVEQGQFVAAYLEECLEEKEDGVTERERLTSSLSETITLLQQLVTLKQQKTVQEMPEEETDSQLLVQFLLGFIDYSITLCSQAILSSSLPEEVQKQYQPRIQAMQQVYSRLYQEYILYPYGEKLTDVLIPAITLVMLVLFKTPSPADLTEAAQAVIESLALLNHFHQYVVSQIP